MTDGHTQDVAASQAPASEDKPGLLERIRDLGAHLNPSEVPGGAEVAHVLGGIVKVLEHQGLEVADELFPEPEAAAAAPAPAGQSAPDPRTEQHESRIGRIEQALEDVIGLLRADKAATDTPPEATEGSPPSETPDSPSPDSAEGQA